MTKSDTVEEKINIAETVKFKSWLRKQFDIWSKENNKLKKRYIDYLSHPTGDKEKL